METTIKEATHTPTPWHLHTTGDILHFTDRGTTRVIWGVDRKDAVFIVKAVNSHEALLKAMQTSIKDIENGSWRNAISVLRSAIIQTEQNDKPSQIKNATEERRAFDMVLEKAREVIRIHTITESMNYELMRLKEAIYIADQAINQTQVK